MKYIAKNAGDEYFWPGTVHGDKKNKYMIDL